MENDVMWISELRAFGAFGSILVIFTMLIRFLIVSHSRSVTKREEAVIAMTQETIKLVADSREVINLNTQAIREHIESMRKGNGQIISQIKRSEANLKKQMSRSNAKGS